MSLDIKVIGAGCDKCDKLYENTKEAVDNLKLDAKITKVEDLIEIVKLGVMTSPSLMINGKLEISAQVSNTKKIMKILNKYMN